MVGFILGNPHLPNKKEDKDRERQREQEDLQTLYKKKEIFIKAETIVKC